MSEVKIAPTRDMVPAIPCPRPLTYTGRLSGNKVCNPAYPMYRKNQESDDKIITAMKLIFAIYAKEHIPHNIIPRPPVHFLPKNVFTDFVATKTPGMIAACCHNTMI